MPPEYADTAVLDHEIADVLNAAATWAGAISDSSRSGDEIANARKQAALELFGAIASNPEGPYWAPLRTLVAHEYAAGENSVPLAQHDGEIGIPKIRPFYAADWRDAREARPDQIDAWRLETADLPRFTGSVDGIGLPHNAPDARGLQSPLACFFSIVAGDFKFTGFEAVIPMFIITAAMRDEKIPLRLGPAVVKRAIPKLVKPGSPVALIAGEFAADGKQDLVEVAGGAMTVRPVRAVSDIVQTLKQL